jgi:hypothetical protein
MFKLSSDPKFAEKLKDVVARGRFSAMDEG